MFSPSFNFDVFNAHHSGEGSILMLTVDTRSRNWRGDSTRGAQGVHLFMRACFPAASSGRVRLLLLLLCLLFGADFLRFFDAHLDPR